MHEYIGVIASIFVLISFTLNGERSIRIANIFGAILFVVYGIIIDSFSIWFLNGVLLIVHAYKLIKTKEMK